MDEKKSDKQRLKEITDSIETGIRELFQSDRYMKYLSVMSRFHRYSVNNQMLIYMQCPNATHVAGFNKWKSEFSRSVKKGERGIRIIAPAPYSKKIETDKLDPDTKLPIPDKDELMLMSIYDEGSVRATVEALKVIRGHIDTDQPELMEMTDAVLSKLEKISEEEYAELDLIPEL